MVTTESLELINYLELKASFFGFTEKPVSKVSLVYPYLSG